MGEGAGDALLNVGKAFGDFSNTMQDRQYQAEASAARREQLELQRKQYELQLRQAGIRNKLDFLQVGANSYDPPAFGQMVERSGMDLTDIFGGPSNSGPVPSGMIQGTIPGGSLGGGISGWSDAPEGWQEVPQQPQQQPKGTSLASMFEGVPGGRAKAEAQDARITNRIIAAQDHRQKINLETWSDKQLKDLTEMDNAIDTATLLRHRVKSGAAPNKLTALVGGTELGSAALQTWAPEQAQTFEQIQTLRQLNQNIMQHVKQSTGVQFGFRELQWQKGMMPGKFDTPENLDKALANQALKMKWAKYNYVTSQVQNARSIVPAQKAGISPEQLRAFSALKKELATLGKDSPITGEMFFSDPNKAQLLQAAGLDDLLQ